MTTFVLEMDLQKWLYQNGVTDDGCLEYVGGCLLDNMIVQTKRGFAAIYEKYQNTNSSVHKVEFQPGDAPDVWKNWEKFREMMEQEDVA